MADAAVPALTQAGDLLTERTNVALLKIIRDNITSKYASQAPLLARFRDAVSAHSGTGDDAALLVAFRTHVLLSNYDAYKPFIDKFDEQLCREEDVKDLLSPGLPDFFAVSSATSGTHPKIFPKYDHDSRLNKSRPILNPDKENVLATLICTGYRDVKVIERAVGEVVQEIPVCVVSGGYLRRHFGWYIDDESKLSLSVPGFAVPWAATVIGHFPSFLIIHALFFLSHRNVHMFHVPFATQFIDLIRHINEQWDVLVSCIRDGALPDLGGIDLVRKYLQAHIHPDPERAAELLEIGPPSSSETWFARVWPKAAVVWTICSGPFATVVPKVKSVLGPNVSLRCPGYASSECSIGPPHDLNKLDEFVLKSDDIVEFLDVSLDAIHENLRQPWEVEVDDFYEPILTTRDGLWRYQLGDIVQVIGFHPESKSPLLKYVGRKSLTIRFPFAQVTDDQLLAAMQVVSSENAFRVHEFSTVLDDRALLPTLGFFIELAGPLEPNARSVPQRLFDALAAGNRELQLALEARKMCLPAIRVVKAGTFAAYRQWKGERANIVSGQIKVPLVLLDPAAQEWMSERVVEEL